MPVSSTVAGTSDASLRSVVSETPAFDRTYHHAVRTLENHALIVNGYRINAGTVSAQKNPVVFRITGTTTLGDGSVRYNYTVDKHSQSFTAGMIGHQACRISGDSYADEATVHVFGGVDGFQGTALDAYDRFVYRLSPATDTMTSGTISTVNKAWHSMIGHQSIRLLVTGGCTTWNIPTDTCHHFTPTSSLLTPLNAFKVARADHQTVALANGNVLAIGGRSLCKRPVLADTCTNYWPLDAISAVTTADIIGGVTLGTGAMTLTQVGKAGFAARPAGVTVRSGAGAPQTALNTLMLGNFTVSAWVTPGTGTIFSVGGTAVAGAEARLLTLGVTVGNLLFVSWQDGAGTITNTGVNLTTTLMPIADGSAVPVYYHVVCTREIIAGSSTIRLYVDGILRETFTTVNNNAGGADALTTIGKDCNAGFADWTTNIDEVGVFNNALTATAVYDLYAKQRGVSWWQHPTVTLRNAQSPGDCINACEQFNGTVWSYTGQMQYGRCAFGKLLLPDGRVLVVGGYGHIQSQSRDAVPLTSCEIWDPNTGLWSPADSLDTTRVYPTLEYVPALKTIVCMGGGPTTVVYMDLATMVWKRSIAGITTPTVGGTGCSVTNDLILSVGGERDALAGSFETPIKEFLFDSNIEHFWGGGLNGLVKVTAVPTTTTFKFKTPNYPFYTDSIATTALSTKVAAATGTIPGPFLIEPVSGIAVSSVSGKVNLTMNQGRQYSVLKLDPSTHVAGTPALLFPDTEGYLVFNFGTKDQVGPVKYLGRLSTTELALDFKQIFNATVAVGSTVYWLTQKHPYVPTALVGQAYLTGSSAGRVAAAKIVDSIVAAGTRNDITVVYPNDIGLGSSGFPVEGNYKLSDAVSVWGGDNLDQEVKKAKE